MDSVAHRLQRCLTLDELRAEFSVHELMTAARNDSLTEWLEDNFFDAEANALHDASNLNDDELRILVCSTLEIDPIPLLHHEAQLLTRSIDQQRLADKRRRECGDDGVIVSNQRELVDALRDPNNRKFYLYDGEYSIPCGRTKTTYVGRDNAVIDIKSREPLDFDGNEIYFYGATLAFRYLTEEQVHVKHSSQNGNRFLYLRADRISLDESFTRDDLDSIFDGRTPFERINDFRQRVPKAGGAIVGSVLLESKNYKIRSWEFTLEPRWKIEFGEMLRRHIRGARLGIFVEPERAKALFEDERKQLVYADFEADGDRASISRLFLLSADLTRYDIFLLWSSYQSSGSGVGGYGLDLITDFD